MKKQHKKKAVFEILLLVVSIFAFSQIIRESSYNYIKIEEKENNFLLKSLKIFAHLLWNEKALVSAQSSDPVSTCIEGKDGSICQEYPSEECAEQCGEECFPGSRGNVRECEIGTCYDPDIGTCDPGAPRKTCEDNGGEWYDDPNANIPQCQPGCCIIGDGVQPLITKQECRTIGERSGIKTEFRSDIRNELLCLSLEKSQTEGACLFQSGGEDSCRFLTKSECLEKRGEFYENTLCTHPSLELDYQKQASARCFDDKLYWVDSEGNKENIYDANKVKSWNNGFVLPESESCQIGGLSDPLENQRTCGNCNRFASSVCEEKTSEERLSDSSIDFVCRNTQCVDSRGNPRQNGESWCEYQSAIGVEEGSSSLSRSVDPPGSRHFRAVCINGEVQVDPCADHRNEVCTESSLRGESGNEVSSASCITNLWQLCLNYNTEVTGEGEERQEALEERDEKCEQNPHCVLKGVNAADNFKFDVCAPKYPPGFDLQRNPEGGELSCSFGSQKCTVVYVKKLFGGWEAEVNEGCTKEAFTQQMNDLCMSLGDCGASVNYKGELSESYRVYNAPKLGDQYISQISDYSTPIENKKVDTNATEYLNSIGGIEKLAGSFDDPTPSYLEFAGGISGALGSLMIAFPGAVSALSFTKLATPSATVLSEYGLTSAKASLTAIGGAAAGAAIGFAVTSMLIKLTGIGAGLDPAVTWSLVGAGAVAGGLIGASLASTAVAEAGGVLFAGLGIIPIAGIILAVIVITIISVFKVLGIGDTKKRIVEFQCQPWIPPTGGEACSECGSDGFPCTKYACQSLGTACQLVNEGTEFEACESVPDDGTRPVITPWDDALTEGYNYEQVSERGFKIVSDESDGCIPSFSPMVFGISLNEAGQCRYDIESRTEYDKMENDFGHRNILQKNHSQLIEVPGVPGFDPDRKVEANYFIRCIDPHGNGERSPEYLVNFCIKPGKDVFPPRINHRIPQTEFVAFNANEIQASIFTNEPAECKWSLSDIEYERMESQMECSSDVEDRQLHGWECSTEFNLIGDENTYFIRCKDQPWQTGENETKRNIMPNSYEFILKRTKTPLKIDSVTPNNETLKFGVKPATVNLEVKTSGGVENGKATCSIRPKGSSRFTEMYNTFSSTHQQNGLNVFFDGKNEYDIRCEDSAGNVAESKAVFSAVFDIEPPQITRAYEESGSLVIVTNEPSQCAFVKTKDESCSFVFEEGTLMSGSELTHTAFFDKTEYYIKCIDKFENEPDQCSLVVRGGLI